MVREWTILLLFFKQFGSNLLSFDTFTRFEMSSFQYFNGDPPPPYLFLDIIKTIPIQTSYINFSKFYNFFRNFVRKLAFSLYISYIKGYIGHVFWDCPYSPQSRWGVFFSHKYIRNTRSIAYEKKKMTKPSFQTATSSGLLKCKFTLFTMRNSRKLNYKE